MADRRPFDERFWSRVEHSWDGCWEWTGAKNSDGYGVIRLDGNQLLAHRCSYGMFVGDLEKGNIVMHSCDNPGCVNPDHLERGDQSENMRDMWWKDRRAKPLHGLNGRFLTGKVA